MTITFDTVYNIFSNIRESINSTMQTIELNEPLEEEKDLEVDELNMEVILLASQVLTEG